MLCNLPVTYMSITVGQIHFTVEGLYWRYEGNLNMNQDGIYRIYGCCGSDLINLGVCRPDRGIWRISGRISTKTIDPLNTSFVVNAEAAAQRFIPLNEDCQFEDLERLDACRFVIQEASKGVIACGDN